MIRQLRWSTISIAEVHTEAEQLWESLQTLTQQAVEFVNSYGGSNLLGNVGLADLTLADCRKVVASSYGFLNWRQLEAHLISTSRAEVEHPENIEVHFQRFACLAWLHYEPAYIERASRMLQEHPHLEVEDIYTASATGNYNLVEWFLEEDPDLVMSPGGFFGWDPLLYACNSRLQLPERSTLQVARLLLEKGADPDAHFMWGGSYRFTALTGAFGEGKAGPVNYPPHPQWEQLADMLLRAGADPNDGQALYNRMFTKGHRCLEMLLDAGLNSDHQCNWYEGDENGYQTPVKMQTLQYQLGPAISEHRVDRAHMLIDHGASVETPEGRDPFYLTALLGGHSELAAKLVDRGAEVVQLTRVGKFAAALMACDQPAASAALSQEPTLLEQMQAEHPELLPNAATANRMEVVKLAINLGADLTRPGYTMLHAAAWHGHLHLVAELIEAGAATGVRDPEQSATPLQWARRAGNLDIVDFLNSCELDIFDAVVCSNVERITAIAIETPEQLETTRLQVSIVNADHETHATDWMTPLAFAATRNEIEAARQLLQCGANLYVTSPTGVTLIDLIAAEGPSEMLELLRMSAGV